MEALALFTQFLADQGMPTDIQNIHREHAEAFIGHLVSTFKPATAANRYRSLRVFFKWAVEEGEIKQSPMQNMKPPHVPDEPPDVLTEDQLRRLLKSCEGKAYEDLQVCAARRSPG
jgi:site-specific recombinase XerD